MKKRFLVLTIIGISVTCLGYVWLQLQLVQVGYTIERLEKRKATFEQEYDTLQVQWSQLTSPQRIAREAKEKLGLGIPQPGQVVMVTVEPNRTEKKRSPNRDIQLAQRTFDQP